MSENRPCLLPVMMSSPGPARIGCSFTERGGGDAGIQIGRGQSREVSQCLKGPSAGEGLIVLRLL